METTNGVEMDETSSIAALAGALAKAQGAMRAALKDSRNPFYNSKFADLASVWDAIREPLSVNGLAVMQRVSTVPGGVLIITLLAHSSGEWVRDRCVWPVLAPTKTEKDGKVTVLPITPQVIGSVVTYGKRYSLSALVGVSADEDDDGNAAAGNGRQSPPQRPATTAPAQGMDQAAPGPEAVERALHAIAAAESSKALADLVPEMPRHDKVRAAYNARAKELRTGASS